MPEYKHRVTVTKSTSNNQISINIENMDDCIVDVSWNDCEYTDSSSAENDNDESLDDNTVLKKVNSHNITGLLNKINWLPIIQVFAVALTLFATSLLIGLLITYDDLKTISTCSIIGIIVIFIISVIACILLFNKPKYKLSRCLLSYFIWVIVVPVCLSLFFVKLKQCNLFITSTVFILIASCIWTILYIKRYPLEYYPYIQIVIQFFLSFITVIGVYLDVLEKYAIKDFKLYYAAFLGVYLLLPLYVQYHIIYHE